MGIRTKETKKRKKKRRRAKNASRHPHRAYLLVPD
jgi:hypothetical protein